MNIDNLKNERGEIRRSHQNLINKRKTEGGVFSPEEKEQIKNWEARLTHLDSEIETQDIIARSEAMPYERGEATVTYKGDKNLDANSEVIMKAWGLKKGGASHKITRDMRSIVNSCNFDLDCSTVEIVRAQTVGTNSAGGYLTSPGIFQGLVSARKTYGGVRGVAKVQQVPTGETRNWATHDGTANKASLVGENTAASNQARSLGTLPIAIYQHKTGTYECSHELLQDSGIDFAQLINDNLIEELIRGQEYHYTVGTGTSMPHGITLAASTVTAADDVNVTTDELQDLIDSVDISYHTAFMMDQVMLGRLRRLKYDSGEFVFNRSAIDPRGAVVFGFPVVVNNWMGHAAGDKAILFGDFKGFQINDALSVTLASEDKPIEGYTNFVVKARSGSRLLNTGAVKALTLAAS